LGSKLDEPSPPAELKQALTLAIEYQKRGLRRITLINTKTGDEITDLEHLIRNAPAT
jgi:hypothetical protein